MLNTKSLDNEFELIASMQKSNKYKSKYGFDLYAEGVLLNLQDYLNEEETVEHCLGENTCLI